MQSGGRKGPAEKKNYPSFFVYHQVPNVPPPSPFALEKEWGGVFFGPLIRVTEKISNDLLALAREDKSTAGFPPASASIKIQRTYTFSKEEDGIDAAELNRIGLAIMHTAIDYWEMHQADQAGFVMRDAPALPDGTTLFKCQPFLTLKIDGNQLTIFNQNDLGPRTFYDQFRHFTTHGIKNLIYYFSDINSWELREHKEEKSGAAGNFPLMSKAFPRFQLLRAFSRLLDSPERKGQYTEEVSKTQKIPSSLGETRPPIHISLTPELAGQVLSTSSHRMVLIQKCRIFANQIPSNILSSEEKTLIMQMLELVKQPSKHQELRELLEKVKDSLIKNEGIASLPGDAAKIVLTRWTFANTATTILTQYHEKESRYAEVRQKLNLDKQGHTATAGKRR